jgi:hypothetical protein
MKKILILFAVLVFLLPSTNVESQVLSEKTLKKFTVGVDVFTDLWQYKVDGQFLPQGYSSRTINQGATAFFMYNMQLGESLSVFSVGLAIRSHNSYSNSVIKNIKATEIVFDVIEDIPHPDRSIPLAYKRSKINLTYLDLPIEFRYKAKGGFKVGVGFKVGYLIDSKQKYVGDWPVDFSFEEEEVQYNEVKQKWKKINHVEKWSYGVTLRVGYKFISVFGYYQFSKIFESARGPDMFPVSLGLTITSF